jgi:hypothetical protein
MYWVVLLSLPYKKKSRGIVLNFGKYFRAAGGVPGAQPAGSGSVVLEVT